MASGDVTKEILRRGSLPAAADAFMKTTLCISVLAISLLVMGCSDSPELVCSGRVVSGTIWKRPVTSPSNEGNSIPKNARVDVYERLIVVHLDDGNKQVVPLDCVSDLKLK